MSLLWSAVSQCCLRRIRAWRPPSHWSPSDWMEEMQAVVTSAALQAERDYDAKRGVPFPAFVHQRMMSGALTRYRQEWSYARRCVPLADLEAMAWPDGLPSLPAPFRFAAAPDGLDEALDRLGETDRRLLDRLFWAQETETEIAQALGISQQAVSKRKRAAFGKLRHDLEIEE